MMRKKQKKKYGQTLAVRAATIIFIGISNLFYFRLLWIVFKKGYKSINQFYDNVLPNVNRIASHRVKSECIWIRLCLLSCVCISSHKYFIHYICFNFFLFKLSKRTHFMISIKIVFNAIERTVHSFANGRRKKRNSNSNSNKTNTKHENRHTETGGKNESVSITVHS